MNRTLTAIAVIACTCYSCFTHAEQPMVGAPVSGGTFLLRENVEIYWNDWIAYPLMAKAEIPTSDQAHVTITGDGKTAMFIGNLSINCENGMHLWESAGAWSEFLPSEEEADKIVPTLVIQNAIKLFCKRS